MPCRLPLTLLAVAACHGASPPAPAVLGRSDVTVAGRAFRGGAVYGRCLDKIHVFLSSVTTPKASVTIHPMGTPAVGRHPLRPGRTFKPDVPPDSGVPGPLFLDGVLPPDVTFEADSGFIDLAWEVDGRLRGALEAWILAPDAADTTKPPRRAVRRLTATFLAHRDPSLEPSLVRGVECAR